MGVFDDAHSLGAVVGFIVLFHAVYATISCERPFPSSPSPVPSPRPRLTTVSTVVAICADALFSSICRMRINPRAPPAHPPSRRDCAQIGTR